MAEKKPEKPVETKTEEKKDAFKSGDVVKLQSGGPKMTVIERDTLYPIDSKCDEWYKCSWFTDRNVHREQSFPVTALELWVQAPRTL